MKLKFFVTFIFLLILASCVSVKNSGIRQNEQLTLEDGWYLCDFERNLKLIEVEYEYFQGTGMKMKYEISYKYTGAVYRLEDGVLYDPVLKLELLIDPNGNISCADNVSIKGKIGNNGRFFWTGLIEEDGKLNNITAKGHLIFIPLSARGGREYDGVYYLRNIVTGKEQIANVSGGFCAWRILDAENRSIDSWPELIRPDGTFGTSTEITVRAEMEGYGTTNTASVYSYEGKVNPGQGITMEELVRTSAQVADQEIVPQIYGGTYVRSGEIPNDAIPADIESLIQSRKDAVHSRPKPDPGNYPSWYHKLPSKPGFIFAAGEKTFADKKIAFEIAESAAAAILLEQLSMQIENEISIFEKTSTGSGSSTGSISFYDRSKTETLDRLNYKVIRREYNNETKTAFVLVEMSIN